MKYYKTPTCFGTEVPSLGNCLVQRNIGPTCQSSYYVTRTEGMKIIHIKISKYIKLTTIKSQCCNIKALNVIKARRSRYSSCLQLYGSCIQTSISILCSDLLLVERVQCIAWGGEVHAVKKIPKSIRSISPSTVEYEGTTLPRNVGISLPTDVATCPKISESSGTQESLNPRTFWFKGR
jgi:hypothetical protein